MKRLVNFLRITSVLVRKIATTITSITDKLRMNREPRVDATMEKCLQKGLETLSKFRKILYDKRQGGKTSWTRSVSQSDKRTNKEIVSKGVILYTRVTRLSRRRK